MTMRPATAHEVAMILDWAAAEGWNPGLDDAAAFHAADPGGFFVACRDGAVVAAICVVNHAEEFAFLGLYLCQPAWRGQGIGFALWRHAMDHAGERTIGLDGVAAQEANYARSGFARTGATVRLQGPVPPEAPHPGLRAIRPADMDALHALDMAANGVRRPAFLSAWLRDTPTRRTIVLQPNGEDITGFATVRQCRAGCKIGPVVAPDLEQARALIGHAARAVATDSVIIDLPDARTDLSAALTAAGFVETFRTARMYRGTPPGGNGTLFGVATMELG